MIEMRLRLLFSLSLTVVLTVSRVTRDVEHDKYCLTTDCVTAAADILKRMDTRVDPCQDFYSFACGGYIEKNRIPDDKTEISMSTELQDKVNEQVCIMLYI